MDSKIDARVCQTKAEAIQGKRWRGIMHRATNLTFTPYAGALEWDRFIALT